MLTIGCEWLEVHFYCFWFLAIVDVMMYAVKSGERVDPGEKALSCFNING